jgi:hypothetical protein
MILKNKVMSGTKKQTSQIDLEKLIVHWPGHYIIGSTPYNKGCRIYLQSNNQLIETFKKNDEAYITMVNHLTGKAPWWPGKKDEQIVNFFGDSLKIQPDSMVVHSVAVKILNLRDESDRLMKTICIDSLDKEWRKKVMKIINKRRIA